MKKIYILSNCNEWKDKSSMSPIMATTSPRKIKVGIINEIEAGNIEYLKGNETLSTEEQKKLLRTDYSEHGESFVFNHLEYGHVSLVGDGERM